MQISKKKIYLCRGLMWGGIGLIAVGAVIYYAAQEYIDLCLALLGGGFIITILGGVFMRTLFRCPGCKTNVLGNSSSIDMNSREIPRCCPNCGTPVRIID